MLQGLDTDVVLNAKRLDDAAIYLQTIFRGLVAMELDNINTAIVGGPVDLLRLFVDKEADRLNERRQLGNNLRRQRRVDVAGGFVVEDKAEGIDPGIYRRTGIFKVCYAADFNFCHFGHL